jgi:hypothetical protein
MSSIPVVTESDRVQLEELDDTIERWNTALLEGAHTIDLEQAKRWVETARRWAVRLQADPPPVLDQAALAKIRKIILEGIEQQKKLEERPLDMLDDLIVRAEAVRHVLRDVLDGDVGVDDTDAKAVLERLIQWLPGVPQKELALLAGRSPRQVQRWLKEGGVAPHRLRLAARVIALLRHGWTPQGVIAWFMRPRRDLGGQAPIHVLDDPFFERDLVESARRGRAQQG